MNRYCTFEPCETDYTVFIREKKARNKRRQVAKVERAVMYVKEVREETIFTGKNMGAVIGYLIKKHPDKADEIKSLKPEISAFMQYEDEIMRGEVGKVGSGKKDDDIEFPKDKKSFVHIWDYWRWKDRLYKILSVNAKSRDVGCSLRAYELLVLRAKHEGKVLHTQEEVANALVKEGLARKCSQQRVSQMVKEVKGAVENLKGRVYELYVKDRLEEEVVEGLFDAKKIKEIMHFGEVKTGVKKGNYPDLVILYENGDVDVVSCKCFNDKTYTISIEDESKCNIKPELEMFEKLHRGEEASLPNARVLMKDDDNNVRLVFMLQSTHEQLPYEVYKVYEKPEELPQSLSFSEKKIKSGVLDIAKWVKNTTHIRKGEVEKNATEHEKRGGRPRKKIDIERVLQLRKEGKSTREIAKELNISHTSVHKVLNKLKRQQNSCK